MAWTRGQAFYQQNGPLAKRWQAARQAHLQQDYLIVLGELSSLQASHSSLYRSLTTCVDIA